MAAKRRMGPPDKVGTNVKSAFAWYVAGRIGYADLITAIGTIPDASLKGKALTAARNIKRPETVSKQTIAAKLQNDHGLGKALETDA